MAFDKPSMFCSDVINLIYIDCDIIKFNDHLRTDECRVSSVGLFPAGLRAIHMSMIADTDHNMSRYIFTQMRSKHAIYRYHIYIVIIRYNLSFWLLFAHPG